MSGLTGAGGGCFHNSFDRGSTDWQCDVGLNHVSDVMYGG